MSGCDSSRAGRDEAAHGVEGRDFGARLRRCAVGAACDAMRRCAVPGAVRRRAISARGWRAPGACRRGTRPACGCGRVEHGRWETDISGITRRVRKYCSGGPVYVPFGRGGSSEWTSGGAAGPLRGLCVRRGGCRSAGAEACGWACGAEGRAHVRQRRREKCRPRRWSQRVAWRRWTSCRAASRRRRLSAAGMTL